MDANRSAILRASLLTAASKRRCQRPLVAAGQADQSGGKLFQVFERCGAFGLCGFAHLEARDELAEILIAGLRGAEQERCAAALPGTDAAAMLEAVSRLPKDETAISAPMCALTPHRLAAVWKRATP